MQTNQTNRERLLGQWVIELEAWIREALPMLETAACIVIEDSRERLSEISGVRAVIEMCPLDNAGLTRLPGAAPGCHVKPVMHPDTWDYHEVDWEAACSRLDRLSSGDLQILNCYLHANDCPTIEGLAEFAAKTRQCHGRNPRLDNKGLSGQGEQPEAGNP
jgi:hypothetical protein